MKQLVSVRPFMKGVIARMTKDDAEARTAFTAARAEQEKLLQAPQSYGPALCVLGLIDAASGTERGSVAGRPAGSRASSGGKRSNLRNHYGQILRYDRCVGWR